MVLGNFDTNSFGVVSVGYVWILFILCTLFNMIIMLNLLIAIISESFANVNSVAQQASYREMADIIAENTYLIDDDRKISYCSETKYLLVATDLQQEQEGIVQFEDQVQLVVTTLSTQTETVQRKLQEKLEANLKQGQEDVDVKIKSVNQQRNEMMGLASQLNEKFHGNPLDEKKYSGN